MAKKSLQIRVHKSTLKKIDAIRMPGGNVAMSRSNLIECMMNKWFSLLTYLIRNDRENPFIFLSDFTHVRSKSGDTCIHVSVTKDCWTRYQKAKKYLRKKHAIVKASLAIIESSFQFWVDTNGD